MTQTHQIIGVCRFSYLGLGGFAASALDQEKLKETLYDPARMRRRFAFFETVCLPSLAAQTDQDFTLVVVTGDTMPMRWRRRLRALAETYTFLNIAIFEPNGPLHASRRAFRRPLRETTKFVTGFRIDDDDAVANDYIARTRETAERLLSVGLVEEAHPAVIAFHRGIYWDIFAKENPYCDFRETAPLGLASAMVTVADAQQNIYRWNHRHLLAHARCWTDPGEIMFLRTLHDGNDSDRTMPPGAHPMDTARAEQILHRRFGLDVKRLRKLSQLGNTK